MIVPSRLAWSASSTIPPMSALTPASCAESLKRVLPRLTVIGCSSGFWSSRWTTRVASAVRMPPTSTPAIVTPLAIRSSRDESYANAATEPPTRTRRRTATRMNHRCLMRGIPGAGYLRVRRPATIERGIAALAPREHGLDRAYDPRPFGVITLIFGKRLEVRVFEGAEQRDHLFLREIVVVLDRPAWAPRPGRGCRTGPGRPGALLGLGAHGLGALLGLRARRARLVAGGLLRLSRTLLRARRALRGRAGRLLGRGRAPLGLCRPVGHLVCEIHARRVREAREQPLELCELVAAQLRGRLVARVLHMRAPAQEVLHLALVPVRLLCAADHGVEAQVLAQLLDRLPARVLVAEAGRLV